MSRAFFHAVIVNPVKPKRSTCFTRENTEVLRVRVEGLSLLSGPCCYGLCSHSPQWWHTTSTSLLGLHTLPQGLHIHLHRPPNQPCLEGDPQQPWTLKRPLLFSFLSLPVTHLHRGRSAHVSPPLNPPTVPTIHST